MFKRIFKTPKDDDSVVDKLQDAIKNCQTHPIVVFMSADTFYFLMKEMDERMNYKVYVPHFGMKTLTFDESYILERDGLEFCEFDFAYPRYEK